MSKKTCTGIQSIKLYIEYRILKVKNCVTITGGQMFGADEFLPALSYVLVQCNMPELLIEVEYMMELLEPTWLTGEGKKWDMELETSGDGTSSGGVEAGQRQYFPPVPVKI